KLKKIKAPIIVLINKIDKSNEQEVHEKIKYWEKTLHPEAIFAISATLGHNILPILEYIKEKLPAHPPYYEKDELTDKTIRFFVSEIIREKILNLYDIKIPYISELIVESSKEDGNLNSI